MAGLDFGLDHLYEASSPVTVFLYRKIHLLVELNRRNLHKDAISNELLQIIVPKLYKKFRKWSTELKKVIGAFTLTHTLCRGACLVCLGFWLGFSVILLQ